MAKAAMIAGCHAGVKGAFDVKERRCADFFFYKPRFNKRNERVGCYFSGSPFPESMLEVTNPI
jgi:hypothetical protein